MAQDTGKPTGVCGCGCGGLTEIAKTTHSQNGWVRGQPKKFIRGHHRPGRFPYEVDPGTDCYLWTGYVDAAGYGRVSRGPRWYYAHRYAYERERGAIPEGLSVDHLCFVKRCVNTRHMELVTPAENTRRGHLVRRIEAAARAALEGAS